MLLITAILFIASEAIAEGLIKRHLPNLAEFIFKISIQWAIAILLFVLWLFVLALPFDNFYVPIGKLIAGFVLVRFTIFDVLWNLARGVRWDYCGTTKLYDRIMFELGGFGYLLKFVAAFMGVCFLLGIESMSDIINMFK